MMMEGTKGGGKIGVGEEDFGNGMMCSNHPYRNNPAGICAFCLQEKLGKLVSSSFPLPIHASSSSSYSSSPSFRSDSATSIVTSSSNGTVGTSSSISLSLSVHPTSATRNDTNNNINNSHYQEYHTRARIPFLLEKKKKKIMVGSSSSDHHAAADIVFNRSKSTVTPRRTHLLSTSIDDQNQNFSPRKRNGFWSFLYLSSKSHTSKRHDKNNSLEQPPPPPAATVVVVGEDESPNSAASSSSSSFERKVSRSRSVGCGSRSFSGDFFERISTGFGDCTLRRVESQREGKPKVASVKCGGIFGGFIITSAEDVNGKSSVPAGTVVHGRSRSWGWAFASPMRAFTKPSAKRDTIIKESNTKSTTPNLSAIPSLLAVSV